MSIKKLFVLGVVLLGVVVMFGATSPAYAATYDGCTISSFTRPLAQGMSGEDVKCLQIILNSDPETQLAVSGAGSPGHETTYFGPITKEAVIKFQQKYAPDILAVYGYTKGTGYVGRTTLAKLNSLLGGEVTPPSTKEASEITDPVECVKAGYLWNGTCYEEGATKKEASEITDPVECVTAGYLWNGTCYEEGEEGATKKEPSEITDPAECVNAGYYWGANGCYSGEEEEEEVVPAEGVITAEYNPEPINNQTLYAAETDKPLVGVKVKAKDSDMTIKRMDVVFDSTSEADNVVPWKYLTSVSVYNGDNLLQKIDDLDSGSFIKDGTGVYRLRFSGLDLEVAKDATEVLTVKVSTASTISKEYDNIDVYIPENGIRGVDTLDLNQYAPAKDIGCRTFSVKTEKTGSIEVTKNVNSPEEGMQLISDTEGDITEGVDLLDFDVKAKNQDVTLTEITVTLAATSSEGAPATLSDDIAAVNLYDGSELLASESASTSVTFDDLSIDISKDSTKTLTVKVDVNDANTTAEGDYVAVEVTKIEGNDANDNSVSKDVSVSGEPIHFYSKAPEIALSGTPTFEITHEYDPATTSHDEAMATIQFTVTAKGSDIYIKKAISGTDGVISLINGLIASPTTTTAQGILSSDADTDTGGDYYEIPKDSTKTFTLKVNVTPDQDGWYNVAIDSIKWHLPDGSSVSSTVAGTLDWGLTKFKTPDVYLHDNAA